MGLAGASFERALSRWGAFPALVGERGGGWQCVGGQLGQGGHLHVGWGHGWGVLLVLDGLAIHLRLQAGRGLGCGS